MNKLTVFDVARYIYENLDHSITQMELHKLLWFCQGWHLGIFDKPLFDGEFVAMHHGPVSSDLRVILAGKKELSEDDIRFEGADSNKLKGDAETLVKAVLKNYGHLPAKVLRELSHHCEPWLSNYDKKNKGRLIPKEEIQDYFSELA